MALKINCKLCKKELAELGAVGIIPAVEYDDPELFRKLHYCVQCWNRIQKIASDEGETNAKS